MANSTRNITVSKDEYALFGKALPYIAMAIGTGLLFLLGIILRLSIWAQDQWGDTSAYDSTKIATWAVLLCAVILSAITWKLFSQRRGLFIAPHATITTVFAHVWLLFALWEDLGDAFFGIASLNVFFIGSTALIISWCIRRWAFRDEFGVNDSDNNPFEEIGLGQTQIDARNSKRIDSGAKYRLKLALGKTIENAKDKREQIAQLLGKPINQVHVSETEKGTAGLVDVTVLDEDPFKEPFWWQGPDHPGASIVSPITYATYDTGQRPELYLAGKNGASSQHFLTMGMSGAGKSKAWQVIYGTVLNRKEVSVLFADPAKGMQTGGPLAAGLEWFEWTEQGCQAMIDAVIAAIPKRTNYLTAKGLDHWQRGCGLNFVIFHLEEAARFAKVDELIELIEAARSAGISIVASLQRATNDRLKTSARYNLGGNMCFGVKMKSDARFGLSEYAIESGAQPHLWQDRYAGYHYLEAQGVDTRLAGHPLRSDWIDIGRLEQEVDNGRDIRDPLDTVTAEALGMVYAGYRQAVEEGTTAWQLMRRNRGHDGTTLDFEAQEAKMVPEQGELPFNVQVEESGTTTTATIETETEEERQRSNLNTDPAETAQARTILWAAIVDFANHGKMTFFPRDAIAAYDGPKRTNKWVGDQLIRWAKEGKLRKLATGNYEILTNRSPGE
jgi:hypothetical protein